MKKLNKDILKRLDFNQTVYYFKYILLLMCLISTINICNNTIVRTFFKALFVFSMVLLLYILVCKKNYFKTKNYILLCFFCLGYLLTILLNVRNHIINEILLFGYTLMFFFVVTYFDYNCSKKSIQNEIFKFIRLIVVFSFVIALVNLVLFCLEISNTIDFTELTYFHRFYKSNQLGGVCNPNTSSMINLISILLSLIVIVQKQGSMKWYGLNIIVQIICFSLSQSRGAWVCLITYIFIYSFFIYKNGEKCVYIQRTIRFVVLFLLFLFPYD